MGLPVVIRKGREIKNAKFTSRKNDLDNFYRIYNGNNTTKLYRGVD